MKRIDFDLECGALSASDGAYVGAGEAVTDALREAIWQAVRLDVNVTVGKVTMPAAMWEDPEHWAEDWAHKLGVPLGAASAEVAILLSAAMDDEE